MVSPWGIGGEDEDLVIMAKATKCAICLILEIFPQITCQEPVEINYFQETIHNLL